MRLKITLQTLALLAAWLVLQNFNLPETEGSKVEDQTTTRGKSMESADLGNLLALHLPPSTFCFPPFGDYKIKKIVLDAGHGGKDPGCRGASSKEKDNALAIVLKVGEMIKGAFPDIEVIYTRDSDTFVELNERAAIANRNNADLFISVHCNSISKSHIHGTETYVMGLHTADHNLEVAKRENASIYMEENYEKNYEGYDPDSPEAHILGSVWQSAYLEQSIQFASFVQQFSKSTASREDRGVKQAGFLVLRETAMPAVLIETGYLTNPTEEEFIASQEGQAQMAQAIFEAFEAYKQQVEGAAAEQEKAKSKNTETASKTTTPPPGKNSSGAIVNSPPKTTAQTTKPTEKQTNKTSTSAAKTQTPTQPKPQTTPQPGIVATNIESSGPFRIFLLSWPMRMDKNTGQMALLSDVKEEKIGGNYHYFTGHYATRAEAEKMLPEIKNLGFRTASIVSASDK
jgi:N-acetylmuramoyl-L-alanine amidase